MIRPWLSAGWLETSKCVIAGELNDEENIRKLSGFCKVCREHYQQVSKDVITFYESVRSHKPKHLLLFPRIQAFRWWWL